MCSVCWDRPFCQYPTSGHPREELALPTDPCPSGDVGDVADPGIHSVPASRMRGMFEPRDDSFYCLPLADHEMNYTGLTCPASRAESATLGNTDTCEDVPRSCRPLPSPPLGCGPEPGDPACPASVQTGSTRTGSCVALPDSGPNRQQRAQQQARLSLIGECAAHGEAPPSGGDPARYCYLACAIDRSLSGPTDREPEPVACDPGTFGGATAPLTQAGPNVPAGAFVARVSSEAGSRALLSIGSDVAEMPFEGQVALFAPGCGPLVSCALSLPLVYLRSTASVRLQGHDIDNVVLINPQPLATASIEPIALSQSMFTLESGDRFFGSGDVSGRDTMATGVFEAMAPVTGFMDWDARIFELSGSFNNGQATVELTLRGGFPNLPPTADAGPDLVLECTSPNGALVSLSALASTDPDGGINDALSFTWTAAPTNAEPFEGEGAVFQTVAPMGERAYHLQMTDRDGAISNDTVNVTVQDTTPPAFVRADLVSDCLDPADDALRLVRLGRELTASATDACFAEPTIRVVRVEAAGPTDPGDIVVGQESFCVRATANGAKARVYTLTLATEDGAGNTSEIQRTITVPGSASEACTNPDALPSVSDGDPVCANGGEPQAPPPTNCACRSAPGAGHRSGLPIMLAIAIVGVAWIRRRRAS